MRRFHGMVFLGNGANSTQRVKQLHTLLHDSISELGGIQQGGSREEQAESLIRLEEAVKDFAAALLGRDISFGEDAIRALPESLRQSHRETAKRLLAEGDVDKLWAELNYKVVWGMAYARSLDSIPK